MNTLHKHPERMMWLAALLIPALMAGCGGGGSSSNNTSAADTTVPTVTPTNPAAGAASVATNSTLSATFSEAMDARTISTSTFTVAASGVPASTVPGAVSYDATNHIATFSPTAILTAGSPYTATITTGAKDVGGNALANNNAWSFTTSAAPDVTPPTVSSTSPVDAAIGVAINSKFSAIFSEAMDSATINTGTFTVSVSGVPVVAGAVTYDATNHIATFAPTAALTASSLYTANISTVARDLAGNALAANKVWSFTTGVAPDVIPPTISSTSPVDAASGVAVGSSITAAFSEAMQSSTITSANFTLDVSGVPASTVAGAVSYVSASGVIPATATFKPTANLAPSTSYTATIATGVKDLAGNAMAAVKAWSFTTAAPVVTGSGVVCTGASCVNLGTAANYVILDEATVTFTPIAILTTIPTITGDVAVSPSAATYMTGFSLTLDAAKCFSTSTQVTGKLYAADYSSVNGCATSTTDTATILTTAIGDKNNAYNLAAAKAPAGGGLVTACPGGGAFDGTVVPPLAAGVYTCAVNVTIPSNFTLNGTATDVWVFQITGTLAQAAATQIILTGGALPQNVFWQVSNGVSIGAGAHMEGVVLSATNIALVTGATSKGRLLARTGVLMDSNTVTQP